MMMNPKSDSAMSGMLALIAFVLVIVFFSGAMLFTLSDSTQSRLDAASQDAAQPGRTLIAVLPTPTPNIVLVTYTKEDVNRGRNFFSATCAGCHGLDGRGIQGLGKTLIESEFVNGLTDAELHDFVNVGRRVNDPMNTTGVEMPARGGNPMLSDEGLDQIIAYIRTLRDPSLIEAGTEDTMVESNTTSNVDTMAALSSLVSGSSASPEPTTDTLAAISSIVGGSSSDSTPTEVPMTAATEMPTQVPTEVAAAPTTVTSSYDAAAAYNGGCAGCHGVDGKGVPGVGTDVINGVMFAGDREAIFTYLTTSVAPSGVGTGYPHPARGGYLNLTDDQTNAVIDYMFSLNPAAAVAPTEIPTEVVVATEEPTVDSAMVAQAASDYAINCAGCHAMDGTGIVGVGSNLADSLILSDDAALAEFLVNDVRAVVPAGAYPHPRLGMYSPMPTEQVQAIVDYTQQLMGK